MPAKSMYGNGGLSADSADKSSPVAPVFSRTHVYMLEGPTKADAARSPSYDVVLKLARVLENRAFRVRVIDRAQADQPFLGRRTPDGERLGAFVARD